MTVNLLTQRLKSAKRELTNLKTAHKRGLGNLKVFKNEYTFVPPGGEGSPDGKIIFKFSQNLAPYPFAYVVGYGYQLTYGNYISCVDVDSITYKDNGYTIEMDASFLYLPNVVPNKFILYSNSLPISIQYVWS